MNSTKETKPWETFWKSTPKSFDVMMQKATSFFCKRYFKKFPVNDNDVILDFGCGPGNFIKNIKNPNVSVVGIDISEDYVKYCKELFKEKNRYFFYTSEGLESGQLENIIQKHNVNKIVVLSVLQYFPSTDEVEKLLDTFRESVQTKNSLEVVIADILPENHSMIKDGWDVLLNSIKENYLFTYFKFVFFTLFQSYSKSKEAGLLQIPKDFFKEYGNKNRVTTEIINNLTLQSSRYSVYLKF